MSSNRVLTKLLIKSDRASTAIFFLTSTVYIAFSYVLHSISTHSPFVRYHMKACAKIVLRPDDEHTLVRIVEIDIQRTEFISFYFRVTLLKVICQTHAMEFWPWSRALLYTFLRVLPR